MSPDLRKLIKKIIGVDHNLFSQVTGIPYVKALGYISRLNAKEIRKLNRLLILWREKGEVYDLCYTKM